MRLSLPCSVMLCATVVGTPALAQTTLDRVDPAKVEAAQPRPVEPLPQVSLPAPPPPTAPTRAAAPITVGAIRLAGLRALHPRDFADIIGVYVGRTLSPQALAGLADEIAGRARAGGYLFATASIQPQQLNAGVLRVDVDEGRVDQVRIVGVGNKAAIAALTPLVSPDPVTRAELERRLLLAGDVDGLYLGRTRLVREGNRNILVVEVGAKRVSGTVGVDNLGSRPIGPVQADVTVKVAQLLAPDDSLTLSAVSTIINPREFAYLRGRYAKRVTPLGTELSLSGSASKTRPGSYLRARDIEGRSWTAGVAALQPLWRRRTESLWAEASLTVRSVKQDFASLAVRRDRVTIARLGAYGYTALAGGYLRVNAGLSQGLDWFDATRRGDPRASRRDGDGTFTLVNLWADWSGTIAGPVSAQVAVASQLASQPLLVSDEVGLGGGAFLRGYDYSERSGDRGAMGSAELRYAVAEKLGPLTGPQLYGFVDGGEVSNLRGGFGSGSLFSTGGGVRSAIGRAVSADVGIAVPLSGPRYDSGNEDPVVTFRLSTRF